MSEFLSFSFFLVGSVGDVSTVLLACVLHALGTNPAAVRGFRTRSPKPNFEMMSARFQTSVPGYSTLTIGSQKFLITIDFIDSARNINFDLKIDISRSKSRNLNFFDIGANIEISILKYRNLNFEISESQF